MAMNHPAPGIPGARLRWPWLLVGIAWVIAIVATLTGQRGLIDHHFLLEVSGLPWPLAALVFLVGWQIMIVAMMWPSSIGGFSASSAEHRGILPHRMHAGYYLSYAGAWTAFGLLAFAGDTLIHHLVDSWPWLAAHSFLIGATTLGLAGMFQFTLWKNACLARCRAFHESVAATDTVRPAWWFGVQHGMASVGCCWALMLVMFGIGVGELGWMAALTVIMFGETAVPGEPRSRRTCHIVGVALVLLAGLWLAHPAWLVPATAS